MLRLMLCGRQSSVIWTIVAFTLFIVILLQYKDNFTSQSDTVDVLEIMPAFDLSKKDKNETYTLLQIKDKLVNLPELYLTPDLQLKVDPGCATYPDLFDLKFHNNYWQVTTNSNGTNYFLFSAFLDVRDKNPLGPSVRILGTIDKHDSQNTMYCQIWFNSTEKPVVSEVVEYKYAWFGEVDKNRKDRTPEAYLMSCKIPKDDQDKVPASVSLVESACENPTTNLKVIYNKPDGPKKKIGICSKPLFFASDHSAKLVEWLETVKLFGAENVHMYSYSATHPNVDMVWDYYLKSGFAELIPITLPGYFVNLAGLQEMYLQSSWSNPRMSKYVGQTWKLEMLPLNDCFYRNMYRYELLGLWDTDEVPVPVRHDNWHDMMKDVIAASLKEDSTKRAGYNFRNAFFIEEMLASNQDGYFEDIPPYLHMLQHVYRSINFTAWGASAKCFHNPENVLLLHAHFALACLEGASCSSFPVDTDTAVLQHYRKGCIDGTAELSCARKDTVRDTSLWKWKQELVVRTTQALVDIGHFGEEVQFVNYEPVLENETR